MTARRCRRARMRSYGSRIRRRCPTGVCDSSNKAPPGCDIRTARGRHAQWRCRAAAGTEITPGVAGVLGDRESARSSGCSGLSPPSRRHPVHGNELEGMDEPPEPEQDNRTRNSYALMRRCRRWYGRPVLLGIQRDDPASVGARSAAGWTATCCWSRAHLVGVHRLRSAGPRPERLACR